MLSRLSRILVVDGSDASRSVTHGYLHGLGYNIVNYAPDGASALRLIGQNNYRLVLADWDMASLDGQDLLRQTRRDQRTRYLPFLMAIGQWQKKFIEIVREDGATLYMTKPFTAEILNQRMEQVHTDASRLKEARLVTPATPATKIPELWKHLRENP